MAQYRRSTDGANAPPARSAENRYAGGEACQRGEIARCAIRHVLTGAGGGLTARARMAAMAGSLADKLRQRVPKDCIGPGRKSLAGIEGMADLVREQQTVADHHIRLRCLQAHGVAARGRPVSKPA
jgi:hypothetical protein